MPTFRPGKPRFRAGLIDDLAVAAGQQVIPLDAIDFEDPSAWAGSVWFCPRGGLYSVTWRVGWDPVSPSAPPSIYVRVEGATRLTAITAGTTGRQTIQIADTLELDTGEGVQFVSHRSPSSGSLLLKDITAAALVRTGPVRWT